MAQTEERTAVFKPEVFEVSSLEQAKAVIVTAEQGISSEERWQKETPFLAGDVAERLAIGPETRVLDYGCGVGRIAKELIDRCGCRVIGIDASRAMRDLAPGYVMSERFTVWSPTVLEQMLAKGFRVDCAISLWVIQHVLDPNQVIGQIFAALPSGRRFYTLNQRDRCVPSNQGWVSDGFDVWSALAARFVEEERYFLPESVATPNLAQQSLIQILRRAD
jgi:SAM-dependent methyltransferase